MTRKDAVIPRHGTPASLPVDIVLARGRYWWHCNACGRTAPRGAGYYATAERNGAHHHSSKHGKS